MPNSSRLRFFRAAVILLSVVLCSPANGQSKNNKNRKKNENKKQQAKPSDEFSRQDRLRGSITPERAWWDVQHYKLAVEVFPSDKRIAGSNEITFRVTSPAKRMQIDLQPPLEVSKVTSVSKNADKDSSGTQGTELKFERDGNVYWISFPQPPAVGSEQTVRVEYGGNPVESRRPPWSGGLTWTKDSQGKDFICTTCQGIGASIWWPNKDHGADEPDRGMDLHFTVPKTLTAVGNGRLMGTLENKDAGTKTFHWRVTSPINNYAVNLNIGNYVRFGETYNGKFGELDMSYYVLAHQKEDAERQFVEAPRVIKAFEHWFGKYPFYPDSYKLVAVPYLGMEHQSSVTYGNQFQNGYRGRDLSGTGVGLKFDFIIVHESGHEWFGNNISMRDAADMWIHESFTNYSECLFVEYHFSKQEAATYVIGCRKNVRNDRPIIGTYNVNNSGSGDMYYKGGNMLHTMRHILNDDDRWLSILRGLNATFRHQTVTTEQVESYISKNAGIDFSLIFDQYLRTAQIPEFAYSIKGDTLTYQFRNCVNRFHMPLRVALNNGKEILLGATDRPQVYRHAEAIQSVKVNRNYYVTAVALKSQD